jgi:hypothetical protein
MKMMRDSGGMPKFDMKNMTEEQKEQMRKMMQNGGGMKMMQGGQGGGMRPAGGTQATGTMSVTIQR